MSILKNFGLLGLILFLLMMVTTIILSLDARSPLKRALLAGTVLYLMLAMSDGAIMFIPVMAVYWFVVSLLISRNPDLD
ncbi:MAG: hypothetical protein KAT79_03690 [candidate division Zixibacteria bacterium]|nr:hypothetical protein [candidate division Zixibacteria bacterium]